MKPTDETPDADETPDHQLMNKRTKISVMEMLKSEKTQGQPIYTPFAKSQLLAEITEMFIHQSNYPAVDVVLSGSDPIPIYFGCDEARSMFLDSING
jgi:hypothetical protein